VAVRRFVLTKYQVPIGSKGKLHMTMLTEVADWYPIDDCVKEIGQTWVQNMEWFALF